MESVNGLGSSLKKSNPSEYGFVYSADRPTPAPEAGWSEKQTNDHKVNLYSENVLKEEETTESVDRASIANLETTKKQWENIFCHSPSQVDASVKKKTTPKWEVRLPYTEKHSPSSASQGLSNTDFYPSSADNCEEEDPDMFKKPVITESAIEREIRLAHEREEMLRQEKLEREKLTQQQKVHGQNLMSSYVTSRAESESNQPAFHELTEADRNPDLWRPQHNDEGDESEENNLNPNESIIEREIRLQREREAEFARMRKLTQQQPEQQPPEQQQQQKEQVSMHFQHQDTHSEDKEDINHNQMKAVSHKDPVTKYSNEVENRIVKELQELREREEEIRRLHISMQGVDNTDETDGIDEASQSSNSETTNSQALSQIESTSSQVSWQKDISSFLTPQRRESVDSLSSQSTGRSHSDLTPSRREVKVRPIADSYSDDDEKKPNYFQKQETPIAREIRLARERENELRKQKGLPEINNKDDETAYSSFSENQETNNSSSAYRPHLVSSGDSVKKFATSRLQQELQEQKERELALLNEGKIITTSEQHIPSPKFMEVGGDKSDGTLKRNFVTKKSGIPHGESETPQRQLSQEAATSTGSSRKGLTVAAGGQLFSYREFRQTAESKIEQELREMKEREEELRKQRSGAVPESPH